MIVNQKWTRRQKQRNGYNMFQNSTESTLLKKIPHEDSSSDALLANNPANPDIVWTVEQFHQWNCELAPRRHVTT